MAEKKFSPLLCDVDTLARSLKLASVDIIKTRNVDIESHWYRSPGAVDFYFWVVKDKLIKHQMNYHGQIIEWNEYDGLRTGYVDETFSNFPGGNPQEMIYFDEELNRTVVEQALDFLGRVDAIEQVVVGKIQRHYQTYPRWERLPLFSLWMKLRKAISGFKFSL